MQLWPILCSFQGFTPFIAALYSGEAKANSAEEYLSDFIAELQKLKQDGINIVHGEKTLQVA